MIPLGSPETVVEAADSGCGLSRKPQND